MAPDLKACTSRPSPRLTCLGEDHHGAAVLQAIHRLVEAGHAEVVLVHLNAVHSLEQKSHELILIEILGDQAMGTAPQKGGEDGDGIQEGGVIGGDEDTALGAFLAHADDLGADPDQAGDNPRDLDEIVPEIGEQALFRRLCRCIGDMFFQGGYLAGGDLCCKQLFKLL